MSKIEKTFFSGKREWSRLKDEVLKKYLPPYLKKVNTLGRPIILVDSFAGPGEYKDSEKGSPYYICKIANSIVPQNYIAILVNYNRSHHKKLTILLEQEIKSKKALTIYGSADNLLQGLSKIITNQTVFVYLDPFGLKGTDFDTLKKFLGRTKIYSTELLINLSIPTILRYSCLNAIKNKGITEDVKNKHLLLSKALGGDYWKDFLLNLNLSTKERITILIKEYIKRMKLFLPYVGYCPVYEKTENSRLKYVIIFASRHPDALLLMNDIMFQSYWKYIWKINNEYTLFSDLNWIEGLPVDYFDSLKMLIIKILSLKSASKKNLWLKIILNRFMRYQKKDYNAILRKMIHEKVLYFKDIKRTGKLNDESILSINNEDKNVSN